MNAITQPQTLINCETTEEWTQERKEAFDKASAYPHTSTTIISSLGHDVPISGVSGAVYAPMDTNPTPQTPEQQANARVARLLDTLTGTLTLLVKELQAPTQPQTDLEEAVSTALEQADWFKHRVEEATQEHIDNMDLDYEIGNQVERYMRNEFDPEDHVDFYDLVSSKVDDVIDDIVSEKVSDAIRDVLDEKVSDVVYDYLDNNLDVFLKDRLAGLLEEKLKDANITINF